MTPTAPKSGGRAGTVLKTALKAAITVGAFYLLLMHQVRTDDGTHRYRRV